MVLATADMSIMPDMPGMLLISAMPGSTPRGMASVCMATGVPLASRTTNVCETVGASVLIRMASNPKKLANF